MMCVMIQASHDHALKVAFIVVFRDVRVRDRVVFQVLVHCPDSLRL